MFNIVKGVAIKVIHNDNFFQSHTGRGPKVAAFHARVWGSVPGFGGLKETKMFLPHPCKTHYIIITAYYNLFCPLKYRHMSFCYINLGNNYIPVCLQAILMKTWYKLEKSEI